MLRLREGGFDNGPPSFECAVDSVRFLHTSFVPPAQRLDDGSLALLLLLLRA